MTTAAPPHETVGFELAEWQTVVDAERQERYHMTAGVDGRLYGDVVDASVLANDCLHGARPKEALGATRLHAGVRVRQSAPVALGAPLTVRARVAALEPAPRGAYIAIDFRFCLADGSAPICIDHRSLILDPTGVDTARPGGAGSRAKPEPVGDADFRSLGAVQLTPAMVSGYSFEFPHLAGHHDPEAAAEIGMRAPIAQGLMGFTLLLAARMRLGRAKTFDVEAQFRRPVFWDDALGLEARGTNDLRAVNADGKPVSTMIVHAWD